MTQLVRAVFGVPLYNKAAYLPSAIESLLGQTYDDFGLVLVDDCSSDETVELGERYAATDGRVRFYRNEHRLGMIGNWRRCYELARELHPAMEYFAWGSDHDHWHPGWLETLVAELDGHPEAVAAYPQSVRISETGEVVRGAWTFDVVGEPSARRRLDRAIRGMAAGGMVYALFRADAVQRAGVFRYVLGPDRLLLAELAMQGELRQVPDMLWERRFTGLAARERQRAAFFPDGAPWWTHLSPGLQHTAALVWAHTVRGQGERPVGRVRGFLLAIDYLAVSAVFQGRRMLARLRKERARAGKLRGKEKQVPIAGTAATKKVPRVKPKQADVSVPGAKPRRVKAKRGDTSAQIPEPQRSRRELDAEFRALSKDRPKGGTPLDLYFAPADWDDGWQEKPIMVFQHIQKTAGTSLRHVIYANLYSAELEIVAVPNVEPRTFYEELWGSLDSERRRRLLAVACHTANYLLPHLAESGDGRRVQSFTLLRDPVDRVLSQYHFFSKAKQWTLDDFYRQVEEFPRYADIFLNAQARSLLAPLYDLQGLPLRADEPEAGVWRQRLLDLADSTYIVGVQEEFDRSVAMFASAFGWYDRSIPFIRINRTRPSASDVDVELGWKIREYNWLDQDLHDWAVERLP